MDDFYNSLKEISLINNGLDEKRAELKSCMDELYGAIKSKGVDKNIIKQNPEMATILEEALTHIKSSTNVWIEHFEESLEQEKFRSDLANYFIIIIFGKVKAGKSSLGNFIAGHRLDRQTVKFFKYDEAGKEQAIKKLEEIDDDQFAINNLECTIEIQGFKLDGMAWIDTPGLGSMVKENGELAKEYIQSADYIIYPTSSGSPLQQDEIKQLKELFEQNKKVTICITKSDETEEDEVDGELVQVLQNKSSNRREAQEKYVKDEISKIIPTDKESVLGDIFSISAHTASKGLKENNEDLFENSNIPKFYELITDVVKVKSKQLKEDAPYDGFRSFIDNGILGTGTNENESSIETIKYKLSDLDVKIKESLARFEILKENANNDLESEIECIVAEYSSKITKDNAKKMFADIDTELHKKAAATIKENISEIFAKLDKTLKSLTTPFTASHFQIEDQFREIKISNKNRNKVIGGSLLGAMAAIGAGIVLAPATGGMSLAITASAAAAAGAIGGKIGGKIGEMTGSDETESVKVGDNKEEVIQRFIADRLKHYGYFAKEIYTRMESSFFDPLQSISNEIRNNLNTFENNIKNIRG
jgi:predicted GTPase